MWIIEETQHTWLVQNLRKFNEFQVGGFLLCKLKITKGRVQVSQETA
jgi:hypothetical protein